MLGFKDQKEINLETLIYDVVESSEIEGKFLNPQSVRSSIAVRLGLEEFGTKTDKNIDGIVDMMLDATQTDNKILTPERLFGWHSCLFPTGMSGMYRIEVGKWRTGAMRVVSGFYGREIVHFQAPSSEFLETEMTNFIEWFNSNDDIDSILKAAIAHLWFITIHPFDDGNGRIARAITDMQLSKSDRINQRFYSMSKQINKDKKGYYKILEQTQRGGLDITEWLLWFLESLRKSINEANIIVDRVVKKHKLVMTHLGSLNRRQIEMIDKLLYDFEGNLNTSKWAKMTKVSTDTALRDITDLLARNILKKSDSGGRSTHYILALDPE